MPNQIMSYVITEYRMSTTMTNTWIRVIRENVSISLHYIQRAEKVL